ncbi:MAG: hypothetical protein AAGD14_10720 [Planctomycetota bacterium]
MRNILGILLGLLVACGGGGGSPAPAPVQIIPALPDGVPFTPLLLIAGIQQVDPVPQPVPDGLDFDRLGAVAPARVFEVTTPAGAPFEFDLVSQDEELQRAVSVSLAHVRDGDETPTAPVWSVLGGGVSYSGSGGYENVNWFHAEGDGFARVTLRGSIERDQIYLVEAETDRGKTSALVCVRVGAASPIAVPPSNASDYPGLLSSHTIYSSPSPMFGLPVAAVSGDRTTVLCYDGDFAERLELRLQFDHLTGAVTGGRQRETNPDSGNWRDHDTAALFNVLAVARSSGEGVKLALSFDRGASFTQEELFAGGGRIARLVSVAIAADYSLAISYWRPTPDGAHELIVERGRAEGVPDRYVFEAPRVIVREKRRTTPLITGLAWSERGDLVIGYGYTRFVFDGIEGVADAGTFLSQTLFGCAVLPWGDGEMIDTLVDWEEQTFARDPSVAVEGDRIVYAYEASDGVRIAASEDGGRTFDTPRTIGSPGSYMPTVLLRGNEVDLFYVAPTPDGAELHLQRWSDFAGGAPQHHRLTTAITKPLQQRESNAIPTFGGNALMLSNGTATLLDIDITELGRFGYDVVDAGDELHVLVAELRERRSVVLAMNTGGQHPRFIGVRGPNGSSGAFVAAPPPPLAAGLTEPVPTPNPQHKHQLRLLRIR